MLMFIGFPAMVSQWVELVSLAYSLRNDMLSDEHVLKCSKTGSGLLSLFFKATAAVLPSQVVWAHNVRVSLGFLKCHRLFRLKVSQVTTRVVCHIQRLSNPPNAEQCPRILV